MASRQEGEIVLAMQSLHDDSERQFSEFTNIVPLRANPREVWSPRLWGILQGIGSQIDGMLKLLVSQFNMQVVSETFPVEYRALNSGGMLSVQKVMLRDTLESFNPFDKEKPDWWDAYNATKHALPDGIYKANLENTVQALGALFILNHIGNILLMRSVPGANVAKDPVERLLKSDSWQDFEEEFRKAPDDPNGVKIGIVPLPPRLLANLQPFTWGTHEWGSSVFYHLSFYWPAFGNVKP